MKTKINTIIKAAAVAATLAFSGASYAADYTATAGGDGMVYDFGDAKSFNNGFPFFGVAVYDVSNGSNSYFAFCMDPLTNALEGASYSAHQLASSSVSDSIKRLYETSYAGVQSSGDKQAAFQLALWELTSDDGNLYDNTLGHLQYFTPGMNDNVTAADGMLQLALNTNIAVQNTYSYISFTGKLGEANSQQLLAVTAAVPEADTWAMLTAGLGLVGFMGRRRKSAQTEKFA